MFGCMLPESILASGIDSGRNENFLFFIRITFRGITKHKSLYLKINSNKISSTKPELNTHLVIYAFYLVFNDCSYEIENEYKQIK